MRFVKVESGAVITAIDADQAFIDQQDGEWIAHGSAGPGWTYDGVDFAPPSPQPSPPAPEPSPMIGVIEFTDRLFPVEFKNIKRRAKTDEDFEMFLWKLENVRYEIDLSRSDVQGAINSAEAFGDLVPGRAEVILAY